MPSQPLSLQARALQWLSQREHSRHELRAKLLRAVANAERAAERRAQRTAATGRLASRRAARESSDDAPEAQAAALAGRPLDVPSTEFTDSRADPRAGTAERERSPDAIEAEVDALLDRLEQSGYLSDRRFAESRVRTRAARSGSLRIVQELRQHGIALDSEAAQALRSSEFDRALALWRRRFGAAPPADAAGRARQMRFLIGRGFSPDAVRRVLRAVAAGVDPEDDDAGA